MTKLCRSRRRGRDDSGENAYVRPADSYDQGVLVFEDPRSTLVLDLPGSATSATGLTLPRFVKGRVGGSVCSTGVAIVALRLIQLGALN
jgi:hypothetical protein